MNYIAMLKKKKATQFTSQLTPEKVKMQVIRTVGGNQINLRKSYIPTSCLISEDTFS